MKKLIYVFFMACFLTLSLTSCREQSEKDKLIEEMKEEGATMKKKVDGDESKIKMETENKKVKIKEEDGETKIKVKTDTDN
ncbi:hypothetical protein DFQ11_104124 [Winogradskyella epiphytica]|uniref:Lipoprotein n=1 Tax=Winogradskyella epiphytica TaxID=262005 RepID=A0A2V4YC96_9FLAO|nr:hypothetical protein [Winogradskyella epiphytica]PYE80757.1 hypothetical protein DFQ11_104124 [Winogradskyella epiphytica]GGW68234.1 hypothetical protein GCM10008085_20190 [Winogradskyella epiphytica]